MMHKGLVCPRCGWERVTTVQVPRHHEPTEPPQTQRAFRCLSCDTQWVDETQWQEIHGQAQPPVG